jgi:hypothetical protein
MEPCFLPARAGPVGAGEPHLAAYTDAAQLGTRETRRTRDEDKTGGQAGPATE